MLSEQASNTRREIFVKVMEGVLLDPSGPKFAAVLADAEWFPLLSKTGRELLLEGVFTHSRFRSACEEIKLHLPHLGPRF